MRPPETSERTGARVSLDRAPAQTRSQSAASKAGVVDPLVGALADQVGDGGRKLPEEVGTAAGQCLPDGVVHRGRLQGGRELDGVGEGERCGLGRVQ